MSALVHVLWRRRELKRTGCVLDRRRNSNGSLKRRTRAPEGCLGRAEGLEVWRVSEHRFLHGTSFQKLRQLEDLKVNGGSIESVCKVQRVGSEPRKSSLPLEEVFTYPLLQVGSAFSLCRPSLPPPHRAELRAELRGRGRAPGAPWRDARPAPAPGDLGGRGFAVRGEMKNVVFLTQST